MIWLPILIMPGVLKAVNTSCGETRSNTKTIIITGTVISIMLCIPYNPFTYLCFKTILRTIVTDIDKVWFSLNVHVLLMSMVITGSIRKIWGWIKLRGVILLNEVLSIPFLWCVFPHHSYLLLLCMFSVILCVKISSRSVRNSSLTTDLLD